MNHLDIAPQYGNAERVVGPLVPAVRERLFVAGKTLRSNPDGVEAQFDDTRRLLGCDVLDLYQAHGVTDLEVLDARAEAIDRIVALRDRGATRFAGITGHDLTAPATFSEALRRWDLDTVMFPVYPRLWADPVYRADAEALLATCMERDVGVMAIKAVARRPWADGRSLAASLDGDPATDARWATRGTSRSAATRSREACRSRSRRRGSTRSARLATRACSPRCSPPPPTTGRRPPTSATQRWRPWPTSR